MTVEQVCNHTDRTIEALCLFLHLSLKSTVKLSQVENVHEEKLKKLELRGRVSIYDK